MKKTALIIVIGLQFFLSCRKNAPAIQSGETAMIKNAQSYFENYLGNIRQANAQPSSITSDKSLRFSDGRTLQWNAAYVFPKSDPVAVIIPVVFNNDFLMRSNFGGSALYSASGIMKLLIYKDSLGSFHQELLSFFPDSSYKANGPFTGIAFADDWGGNAIAKYKFEKNQPVKKWKDGLAAPLHAAVQTQSMEAQEVMAVGTCYTIEGYNYSADDPDIGYYWSEPAGCSYSFIAETVPASGGGAGSGAFIGSIGSGAGSSMSPAGIAVVAGGNSPIANIQDYDKCFFNIAGSSHTYTVTVCVDQPVPGTRQAWGLTGTGSSATGSPVDVGHCFLVMTEVSGTQTITRNIGFYPTGNVNPISPSAQGSLNNDGNHGYNISLAIKVTNSQFFTILSAVSQGNNVGNNYNLNTNNCTSFVIHSLAQANIYLPSTIGVWANGSGNDPGDLGEDIRSMTLLSNMTRNGAYNYHPNVGSCN